MGTRTLLTHLDRHTGNGLDSMSRIYWACALRWRAKNEKGRDSTERRQSSLSSLQYPSRIRVQTTMNIVVQHGTVPDSAAKPLPYSNNTPDEPIHASPIPNIVTDDNGHCRSHTLSKPDNKPSDNGYCRSISV